jgi:hypothetical protein
VYPGLERGADPSAVIGWAWLLQWHNELDPAHGERMGDYFAGFLDEAARSAQENSFRAALAD